MTGISYKVEIDDAVARERLDRLIEHMDRPEGFYKNVGERLLNSAKDNFEREAGPDGVPWTRLMPKTIQRREKMGLTPIRILRARGRLAGSLNIVATSDEVRIGSPVKYAAIDQLGGRIAVPERSGTIYQSYDAATDELDQRFRKKKKSNFAREVKIKAHTIDIPARPYVGVSEDDEEAIIEIAQDWLRTE